MYICGKPPHIKESCSGCWYHEPMPREMTVSLWITEIRNISTPYKVGQCHKFMHNDGLHCVVSEHTWCGDWEETYRDKRTDHFYRILKWRPTPNRPDSEKHVDHTIDEYDIKQVRECFYRLVYREGWHGEINEHRSNGAYVKTVERYPW